MVDEVLIEQIKEATRFEPEILAVYVFGSHAKGSEKKESDFDIAFVVEDKTKFNEDRAYNVVCALSFPADVDIVVVDKHTSPLLLFEIIAFGKRIYGKNNEITLAFETYVLKTYYDTAHMRNIYYQYLKEKFPIKRHANQ